MTMAFFSPTFSIVGIEPHAHFIPSSIRITFSECELYKKLVCKLNTTIQYGRHKKKHFVPFNKGGGGEESGHY